ncbi:MAG: pyroglutamyl-peptidase I [Planctomycetota bacterium]|nr:pyroglutamyl-peptidase I [Planctomycetota bacterium]
MRVYLTGFEPFGSHTVNASWEAVKDFSWTESRARLHSERLPVDYRALRQHLPERLNTINPDVILHLGVMGPRGFLRLEQQAKNHIGASPDNAGFCPEDRIIEPSGPEFLRSSFPLETVLDRFRKLGMEGQLSDDAGSYLCNFSYYLSLDWAQRRNALAAFLHVPVLGEPFAAAELQEAIRISLEVAIEAKNEAAS